MSYQPYASCYRCSGRAQPGTVALLRYLMDRFPNTGSLGVYNCRDVAGSNTLSQHACGRAGDSKIPTTSSGGAITSIGNPVVQFLAQYSTQFGITQQIYNRVIYDAKSPKGRYYGGVHPHRDHVHWAQTSSKATSLTYSQIVSIAGPAGGGSGGNEVAGLTVEQLQTTLNKIGAKDDSGAALKVDGEYGPKTEQAWMRGLKMGPAATGGGVTMSQVTAESKKQAAAATTAHAKVPASATVHPHRHAEGTTGPPVK